MYLHVMTYLNHILIGIILFLLSEHVESYLSYAHIWVQLAASQLFGLLFAAWQPEQLVTMETKKSKQYITTDTYKKVRIT